jgi:hypothetical protein
MCDTDGELGVVRALAGALADDVKDAARRLDELKDTNDNNDDGSYSGYIAGELVSVIDDLESVAVRLRTLGY